MKKMLAFVLMFVFAATLVACTSTEPAGVTISGGTQVQNGGTLQLTATVTPEGAAQDVVWTSSDAETASVNATGLVSGNKLGTVVITATATGTDISRSVTISVVSEAVGGDPATAVTITSTIRRVAVGATINITARVEPATASQELVFSSNKPEVAVVSETGAVTGVSNGSAVITVAAKSDEQISKKVLVTVDAGGEVQYPDLGGFNITIAEAGHALGNQDPALDTYTGLDKDAKLKAWRQVEQEFNCIITVQPYPDSAPWGPTRIKYINDQAAIGQPEFVIYVTTTDWTAQLASGNSVLDVTNLYAEYGSVANMGEGFKRAGTYGNKLYAISNSDNGVEYGLFYNLKLIRDLMDKTPAEMFNEGNWTIFEFTQYCTELQQKLNALSSESATYYACAGEISYYWAKMLNASNVAIADVKDMKLHLTDDVATEVITSLRAINTAGGFDPEGGYDASNVSFKTGLAAFCPGDTWFVNGADRWNMEDFEYGFVPYPRSDEISKEDTKTAAAGGSCWMMASNYNYPAGVTSTDVYRAIMRLYELTNKNVTEDPTYDEVENARAYAQKYCHEDAGVEAVLFFTEDKVIFDPFIGGVTSFYAGVGMGALIRRVVREDANYQEEIDGVINTLNETFQRIYGA